MEDVSRSLEELALSGQTDAAAAAGGHLGNAGAPASQQLSACSVHTVTPAAPKKSPAAPGKPAVTSLMDGGRWFIFVGKPVCAVCGDKGHLASICATPFCALCSKHGHSPGLCEEACSKCGQQQTACKGKRCRTAACSHCGLYGHEAPRCPRAECIKCGYFGHMMSECPVPDTAASDPLERSHNRVSSGPNDGGQSLTDSLLADNSSHSKPAKAIRQISISTDVDKLQLAARLLGDAAIHPPKLELLPPASSPEEAQERGAQLVHALFSQYPEYSVAVVNDSSKLACLSRITPSNLAIVLANPNALTLLDKFYQQQKLQQEQERQRQEQQQKQRQRQLGRERQRQPRPPKRNQQAQGQQQRRQYPCPEQERAQQQQRQCPSQPEQAQQQQMRCPPQQEKAQQQPRQCPPQQEQAQQQQQWRYPPQQGKAQQQQQQQQQCPPQQQQRRYPAQQEKAQQQQPQRPPQQEQAQQQQRQYPPQQEKMQQQQQQRQRPPQQEQAQQQQRRYPHQQERAQQQQQRRRQYPLEQEQAQQHQRQYVPRQQQVQQQQRQCPPQQQEQAQQQQQQRQYRAQQQKAQQQRRQCPPQQQEQAQKQRQYVPHPLHPADDVKPEQNGRHSPPVEHAQQPPGSVAVQRPLPAFNVLDDVLPRGGRVGSVLVCLACGAVGHQVSKCRTPFCNDCLKYGHTAGDCSSGCSRCGWRHGSPCDDQCVVPQCGKCSLWGHNDAHCPVPRCSSCGTYGHRANVCPKLLLMKKCQVAPVVQAVEVP